MRALSLFSGVGGIDLGLERAGVETVGQVEIDPARRRVLAKHWPDVPRKDDVRDVKDADWCGDSIDLIHGGFPCQDLSVAGKRAGLAGERSGLWFEFHRVIAAFNPAWCLIENVPGLLSSNEGRDFAVILQGLVELGYGVAWRILDAQYFGVPQRRRRVFVIGCRGDTTRAAQILFESESLRGDSAPFEKSESQVAAGLTSGSHPNSNRLGRRSEDDVNLVVNSNSLKSPSRLNFDGDYVVSSLQGGGGADTESTPKVRQVVNSLQPLGGGPDDNDAQAGHIIGVIQDAREIDKAQNGAGATEDDLAYTMDAQATQAVVYRKAQKAHHSEDMERWEEADFVDTLDAEGQTARTSAAVVTQLAVRRLTPTEALRLQGLPDDWLDLKPPLPDSAKYRCVGDSVAVPVLEWIGERLVAVAADPS
jgi:DNA (cytosine-5)-methyltransferase 1